MSITASRIGSAPMTADWTHLQLSHGPATSDAKMTADLKLAWSKLRNRFQTGEIGFYDSPTNPELSQIQASLDLAQKFLPKIATGEWTDCLFLGIGGSSLGPLSLLSALKHKCNALRFHFIENPDATEWLGTLKHLRQESTLVVVVTKSGTTFETLAQFLLALEWMGPNRLSQVVAITDPVRGDLRQWVNKNQVASLPIAPSIGGRYSIFTPVGLFAAALAGLDAQAFLQGASLVRDYCEKPLEPARSALQVLALEYVRQAERYDVHVCMPYSSGLKLFGNWFVQMWGESLGKNQKGFTPVAAVGATDQHSILQLLRDGPNNKITTFITVDRMPNDALIPTLKNGAWLDPLSALPAFKILAGHSLHRLLNFEYRAISLVLSKNQRPQFTLQLDELNEKSLGGLYFFYCALTALTGTLMEIDPFDQPGVEEGKVYIQSALDQQREELAHAEDEESAALRLRRGSN